MGNEATTLMGVDPPNPPESPAHDSVEHTGVQVAAETVAAATSARANDPTESETLEALTKALTEATPVSLLPVRPAYVDLPVGQHHVSLLKDGHEAFPAMLAAISVAKSTVCLETYILRSDTTGQRFAAVLMESARAGVEVNVIYDGWGSSVSRAYLDALHEAGVRTLEFHPIHFRGAFGKVLAKLRRRNHRKSLIVDGTVAFTGGANIADDYASVEDGGKNWRDTCMRFEGPSALELSTTSFGLGAGSTGLRWMHGVTVRVADGPIRSFAY